MIPHQLIFFLVCLLGLCAAGHADDRISIQPGAPGQLSVNWRGVLQTSADLQTWTTLSPQPQAPAAINLSGTKQFFRSIAGYDFPLVPWLAGGSPALAQNGTVLAQDSFSADLDDPGVAGFNVYPLVRAEFQLAGQNGISLIFARGFTISSSSFTANRTALDTGLTALVEDNPQARIVVVVGGLHPLTAWYNANGLPYLKNESGTNSAFPDINSPIYRAAAVNYVKDIVTYIESRPYAGSVVGYQVAAYGGGEFNLPTGYWGFSAPTRTAFQTWLAAKYGTIDSLKLAWGDSSILSFADILVPASAEMTASDWGGFRNPATRRKAMDFSAFWQESDAGFVAELCGAIKSASAKDPLAGAFYGYTLELSQNFASGHHALRKLLASPDIDFLAAPYSYAYRASAWLQQDGADIGAGAFHGAVDSILANGKLFFTEDDSRTYLTGAEDTGSHFTTLNGTIANLRRNHIANATRGSGLWRLDLRKTGWYQSPELMHELGAEKAVGEALLSDPSHTVKFAPDVAVILDEASTFNVAATSSSSSAAVVRLDMFLRDHLQRAGVSYGVYLIGDLVAGRVPDCPAYLFAGTYEVSTAERAWIDANLKKDGKTLAWFYGSGLYDENGYGLDKMKSLTGFDFAEAPATDRVGSIEPTSALTPTTTEWNAAGSIAGQPEWYVSPLPSGAQTIGNYVHGSTRRPAVVLTSMGTWNSLYIGSVGLTKKWALGLMKAIGVHRYLETEATVPCYAGRGIIGIWPTEAMSGTVKLKANSDVYDLYTGEALYKNVSQFPVSLAQWDVRAYKLQAPGSSP